MPNYALLYKLREAEERRKRMAEQIADGTLVIKQASEMSPRQRAKYALERPEE